MTRRGHMGRGSAAALTCAALLAVVAAPVPASAAEPADATLRGYAAGTWASFVA